MKRVLATLAALCCAVPVAAHQADTSYTRIRLEPTRLATELTFDLHVLGMIVRVDRDGDGSIDRAELEAVAPSVQAYLLQRILVDLDDRPASLGTPLAPEWSLGEGAVAARDWPQTLVRFPFQRALDAAPEIITLRYATWLELGPTHTNLTSIEEGTEETLEVVFTQAEPDYDYFSASSAPRTHPFARFVRLGVVHILGGLDHVLFLLALLVVSRLRELLQIVTAFTVAHSITLGLAVLGIVALPSRWVEAGIAATIVWVAFANLRGRRGAHRWPLTFAFGLVHGFGFAAVLAELDLPAAGLLRTLVGFNLGVELGQLVLVAGLFPLAAALARTRAGPGVATGVSVAVGAAGVAWLVERSLGLGWLPV